MKWDFPSAILAIDSNSRCMGDSPYCVYEWMREDKPFYVGLSKGHRFQHTNPGVRSEAFNDVYAKGGCRVRIVAYGMSETDARRIEKEHILKRLGEGCHLVNKQYVVDYYHTPNHMREYERRRGMKYVTTSLSEESQAH